ncbi:DUF6514 family protein [Butyricicoccus faecihominis]|uniref:DUF6514 family protein n=1 Tax=Butyricicoccus faecihominis TaxID=1712515 RepID=UPI002479ADB3|nr:DUF6514 family protein [Butyricicoccus faecihominis]MCQ5128186.1 DUF6514 family protein [Butyricicoccus faecihominis]
MYTVSICNDWYGIAGNNVSAADITTSREEISELLELLNRNEVSEIHFFDALEDWFGR